MPPKRVCEKQGSSRFKSFEHQVYHRNMNPCLTGLRQLFIVFAESPAPAQPGQGPLHHPSPGAVTSNRWLAGFRRTTLSTQPPAAQAHAASRPA